MRGVTLLKLVVAIMASSLLVAQAPAPEAPAPEPPPQENPNAPNDALKTNPLPGDQRAPSFQTRSNTRAGGPANELNTGDKRAKDKPAGGSVIDTATGSDLYHGNYCGKGDRGPGRDAADELDAACKRHDACYDRLGRDACECDNALRGEALGVAQLTRLSREVRARAASVAEAFDLMRCKSP